MQVFKTKRFIIAVVALVVMLIASIIWGVFGNKQPNPNEAVNIPTSVTDSAAIAEEIPVVNNQSDVQKLKAKVDSTQIQDNPMDDLKSAISF